MLYDSYTYMYIVATTGNNCLKLFNNCVNTHTHINAYTHTYIHTHAHTYTYTHIYSHGNDGYETYPKCMSHIVFVIICYID